MNAENFHEYVKNPSMLHQVSSQSENTLVLQYPYSPNLRYLLLLKSLFDQSKDFDRNQVLASLSSPDRKKLRQLVKQYSRIREIQENYALNGTAELKDLSVLERPGGRTQPRHRFSPYGQWKGRGSRSRPLQLRMFWRRRYEEESDLTFLKGLHFDQDEIAVLGEPEQAPTESLPGGNRPNRKAERQAWTICWKPTMLKPQQQQTPASIKPKRKRLDQGRRPPHPCHSAGNHERAGRAADAQAPLFLQ